MNRSIFCANSTTDKKKKKKLKLHKYQDNSKLLQVSDLQHYSSKQQQKHHLR